MGHNCEGESLWSARRFERIIDFALISSFFIRYFYFIPHRTRLTPSKSSLPQICKSANKTCAHRLAGLRIPC